MKSYEEWGECMKPWNLSLSPGLEKMYTDWTADRELILKNWGADRIRAEAAEHKAQLAQTAWANAGVRAQQAEAERDRLAERVQQLENLGQELFYREENERLAERVRVLEEALSLVCHGNDIAAERNESPKNWPGSYAERKARAALDPKEEEIEEPPKEVRRVTREMALDAGDPSLEGQKI